MPLAPLTTLGVGGAARWFVEATDEPSLLAAFGWARERGLPFRVMGGGSNLVVADEGIDGLVVRVGLRGIEARRADGMIELSVAAGEVWDDLVRHTVEQGWAGLECLSGIPGLVGATPMQNVGAYGQEVSDTVVAVRALDTASGGVATPPAGECGFGYRDSRLKSGEPGRFIVLAVRYRLEPGGKPRVRYADIERDLAVRGIASPTLADVRETVLAVRRSKSMVLDAPDDPNRRSCGSFFTNPIVPAADAARVESQLETLTGDRTMPRWPQADGRVKLSAAWLIERAGFRRGEPAGPAGLSTRHALAIVARPGARASDVVDFARRLQAEVERRFGVRLTVEPVLWGFDAGR
ncbi:MAG: UDP-N-acetylmuramate dehydrogenase [Candidatus Rokuibacteriota bacterium]